MVARSAAWTDLCVNYHEMGVYHRKQGTGKRFFAAFHPAAAGDCQRCTAVFLFLSVKPPGVWHRHSEKASVAGKKPKRKPESGHGFSLIPFWATPPKAHP